MQDKTHCTSREQEFSLLILKLEETHVSFETLIISIKDEYKTQLSFVNTEHDFIIKLDAIELDSDRSLTDYLNSDRNRIGGLVVVLS